MRESQADKTTTDTKSLLTYQIKFFIYPIQKQRGD